MSIFPAGVVDALFSTFRRKKSHPTRPHSSRRPPQRRTSLGHRGGAERLELRSLPSANPLVVNAVPVSGFETQALTNVPVATFTDGTGSEPASNFKAAIVWGDGATSTGTVIESGGSYIVVGSHTYSDISDTPVIVGIVDTTNPGANAVVVDTADIAPILPDGTQGTADQRYVYEVLKDTQQGPITMNDVNYWTGQFEKNHDDRQTFVYILLETTPPYSYDRLQIDNAYETYLHRAADTAGENFFLQLVLDSQGQKSGPGTEKRTAALLINSNEFYQDAGGTVQGFITAVYEDALKRAPDPTALVYFENALNSGAMTHIEFATTILNSSEFLNLSINGLFEKYLGRPVDPNGLQTFVNNFNNGYGTQSNTETLLTTPEFYNRAVGLPLNTID
ncbi:MAG TPA: DUF4214 domain-containing protein [Pirellulales bacterium]|nr:DUF4214 domain-containing protein [Pirellulales bacterium]